MKPAIPALALILSTVTLQAADTAWLQWGGPRRNFMVDTTGLASTWPANGPRRLWDRTIGEGHSAIVVDGNRNGVRLSDVQGGVDGVLRAGERLADKFANVSFGALPGLPAVDPSGTAPGADPIRLGANDMVTFTPLGSSSPGSLYIRGRGNVQYVLRVFAETGKIRILKFYPGSRQWRQL